MKAQYYAHVFAIEKLQKIKIKNKTKQMTTSVISECQQNHIIKHSSDIIR